MRRVSLGLLSLAILGCSASTAFAARSPGRGKTIKDLSGTIPLGLLERSVGPKFYRSLLVSPLEDWSIVRARIERSRLAGARVIRSSQDPAYNSVALKFAHEMTLVAYDRRESGRQWDSAVMHLLIYRIADGVMAVSFAYPEGPAGRQNTSTGTVRLSVKAKADRWTDIQPAEMRQDKGWSHREPHGRRLRRMDRMPMDLISVRQP